MPEKPYPLPVQMSEALSASASVPKSEPDSASVTDLLALALRIERNFQKGLLLGSLVMIYSLAAWAMVRRDWVRFALVPVFSACSLAIVRFGAREK